MKTTIQTLLLAGRTLTVEAPTEPYALVEQITADEFAVDERLPYWAELWPSAVGLTEAVLAGPSLVGQSVIELGCGLGLVGTAAALRGAERVVLTDYEDDALRFARRTLHLNGVGPARASTALLDWRRPDLTERFSLALAADVLYERRNLLPLVETLLAVLRPGGRAIIADPGRATAAPFRELLVEQGFTVTVGQRATLHYDRPHTLDLLTAVRP